MKLDFQIKLVPTGPKGEWCFLHFPFDMVKTFGTRARVPVSGTINRFPFRSSLMPMDGKHVMCVNKEMQAGAKAKPGDWSEKAFQYERALSRSSANLKALSSVLQQSTQRLDILSTDIAHDKISQPVLRPALQVERQRVDRPRPKASHLPLAILKNENGNLVLAHLIDQVRARRLF